MARRLLHQSDCLGTDTRSTSWRGVGDREHTVPTRMDRERTREGQTMRSPGLEPHGPRATRPVAECGTVPSPEVPVGKTRSYFLTAPHPPTPQRGRWRGCCSSLHWGRAPRP